MATERPNNGSSSASASIGRGSTIFAQGSPTSSRGTISARSRFFSRAKAATGNSLALFNFLTQLPVPGAHARHGAYRQRGSARLPRRQQTNLQPFARFFFHEYVWGFDGSSTLYQIDEATDLDFARKIMRSRAKLPSKILLCMGRRILRSSSRRRPRPMASSRISSSSARPARTAWASPCGRPDTR